MTNGQTKSLQAIESQNEMDSIWICFKEIEYSSYWTDLMQSHHCCLVERYCKTSDLTHSTTLLLWSSIIQHGNADSIVQVHFDISPAVESAGVSGNHITHL